MVGECNEQAQRAEFGYNGHSWKKCTVCQEFTRKAVAHAEAFFTLC